jgi:hypothetical protein
MTPVPRVPLNLRRAFVMILLSVAVAAPAVAQTPAPAPGVNAQGAAIAEFQARLDTYLDLRSSLAGKLKPLSVTPDAAELAARQESLGAAMRTAREGARRGDLIPPAVADLIAKTVKQDFVRRRATVDKAVLKEVPDLRPAINKVYAAPEGLPTMPPLVLADLPRLPDNLQYRYLGRSVVLFDGDLHIIVDYIPAVLPPH